MIMINSNFIFNFSIFYVIASFFLTKLLTLGFLFLTEVRAVAVNKNSYFLFHLISILVLRAAVVAKLVKLCIWPLTSFSPLTSLSF